MTLIFRLIIRRDIWIFYSKFSAQELLRAEVNYKSYECEEVRIDEYRQIVFPNRY